MKVEIKLNGQGQISAQSSMLRYLFLGVIIQDVSAEHLNTQLFSPSDIIRCTAVDDDGDFARVIWYHRSRFVVDTSNRREMRLCMTNLLLRPCRSFPATHSAGPAAEEVFYPYGAFRNRRRNMYEALKGPTYLYYTYLFTQLCILFGSYYGYAQLPRSVSTTTYSVPWH